MKLKFKVNREKAEAEADQAGVARTMSIASRVATPIETASGEQSSPPGTSEQADTSGASPQTKMAPVEHSDHKVAEDHIKDVIQDLYQIMVQVNSYDQANKPSKDILENSVKQLYKSLQEAQATASSSNLPLIPPELIQYVDNGRNPDIYTREFVEGARKSNQLMKGKMEAYGEFRDVLATEMARTMPELREDIGRILDATGGRRGVVLDEESS